MTAHIPRRDLERMYHLDLFSSSPRPAISPQSPILPAAIRQTTANKYTHVTTSYMTSWQRNMHDNGTGMTPGYGLANKSVDRVQQNPFRLQEEQAMFGQCVWCIGVGVEWSTRHAGTLNIPSHATEHEKTNRTGSGEIETTQGLVAPGGVRTEEDIKIGEREGEGR